MPKLVTFNPRGCLVELVCGEETYFGSCEGTTKYAHSFFPPLITNKCYSFDIREVFNIELDIFPQRAGSPAMEVMHLKQHSNFSELLNQMFDFGDKMFVIFFR
jgi:hypothetical protein